MTDSAQLHPPSPDPCDTPLGAMRFHAGALVKALAAPRQDWHEIGRQVHGICRAMAKEALAHGRGR